ncbi:MAG: NYN domain-containing protein [Acidobacteria bacterium]|nr:NYN domain-containing protein [Acidobacteriota bacterium]
MAHQERTNIAVFIDFDNIEIGVKTTLGEHFDISIILEALKERGEVVTKIAYADWTRAGEYSRALTQHAIRLVQRNLTPGGDKNGADINLALDALEMAFTHPHINAYVIVGGDSDFLSLVEKLKQYDKKVFVVGGRSFTSVILQRNCHEFIAYENLMRGRSSSRPPRQSSGQSSGQQAQAPVNPTQAFPIAQAIPIVRRALKILADREVSPQTGLLKSTLLQLDSTFSERSYGASSFLDFVEKLAQGGVVLLKHSGRSVMVELNPAFADESSDAPKPRTEGEAVIEAADNVVAFRPAGEQAPTSPEPAAAAAPSRLGDQADGVRAAVQLLANATNARWPMYLRNVKQVFRAANFDERRYGFGGLMDLLKACQRDGLVRIERDRRGGLRVFQGPNMARPAQVPQPEPEEADGNVAEPEAAQPEIAEDVPPVQVEVTDESEPDVIEIEPVEVVDTTAELLGRAKPRAPRARAGRTGGVAAATPSTSGRTRTSGGARKTGGKKAAGAKKTSSRSRKPVNKDDDNFGNR